MLLNPYRFGLPLSALLTGLVSYWKLDEASGDALDSYGTNDLTDVNTVGTAIGKIGNARDFDSPSGEYFTRLSGDSLSTGDIDFTFSVWVKIETNKSHDVISKWTFDGATDEFFLEVDSSRIVYWRVNTPGGTATVNSAIVVVVGQWCHILVWHDSVLNQIGIRVNDTTTWTAVATGGVLAKPAKNFRIGLQENAPSDEGFNGMIDEVGCWKRMLTPAEYTQLYNAGNGLTYPFGGPLPTLIPVAAFSGTPLTGTFPLSVTFTDLSVRSPTSWSWAKNNGSGWVPFAGTPTAQNPTEIFAVGAWSVRLTATNSAGSDDEVLTNYVAEIVYAKWTDKSGAGVTFSNNDLTASASSGNQIWRANNSFKVSFGRKIYWEVKVEALTTNNLCVGLKDKTDVITDGSTFNSSDFIMAYNGGVQAGPGWSMPGSGGAYAAGDVLMFAIDETAGRVWLGKNGTWFNSGNPAAGTGFTWSNMPAAITFAAGAGPNGPSGLNSTTLRVTPSSMQYTVPSGFTSGLST